MTYTYVDNNIQKHKKRISATRISRATKNGPFHFKKVQTLVYIKDHLSKNKFTCLFFLYFFLTHTDVLKNCTNLSN